MNSALFDSIGLSGIDPAYIFLSLVAVLLIMFILIIVQMVKFSKLKKKYEQFMLGKNAESMEEEIMKLFSDIEYLKSSADKNGREIKNLYKKQCSTFQKVGLVKYDAFSQMGGKLSFCLAMLDEEDNGFVMNSVHSTDGCYSYIKAIESGTCKLELGGEEEKALKEAMYSDKH